MKAYQLRLHRQQGNTITGIVIGLVIGLGIAVAVALLITKSSTPFTNKGVKDKPDQPVAQLQDPNKPLYGNKDAVKEASKDFVKESTASKPAETAVPPVAAVKSPDIKIELKPAQDKPVEKAEKPADTAKADAAADDKYVYFLQAGAFKEQADAENARAKLALIGFEAKVSEKTSETGTMYRVRIGPFGNVETMNRVRSRLSENSVDVAVVRTIR